MKGVFDMKIYEKGASSFLEESGNKIDFDGLTKSEIICLYAFQFTIIKNVESISWCYYTFSDYGEDCVSLYKNNQSWEVYIGERGVAHNRKIFDDCAIACMTALSLFADSYEIEKQMLFDFYNYLKRDYTKEQLENFEILNVFNQEEIELLNDFASQQEVRSRILKKYGI